MSAELIEKLQKHSRERQKLRKQQQKKTEFSKVLLIQESVLIWLITIAFVILAYVCIVNQYFGELPWLAAMVGFPWTAYGVSQGFYYRKSEKENTKGGIKYETVMSEYGISEVNQEFDENAVG